MDARDKDRTPPRHQPAPPSRSNKDDKPDQGLPGQPPPPQPDQGLPGQPPTAAHPIVPPDNLPPGEGFPEYPGSGGPPSEEEQHLFFESEMAGVRANIYRELDPCELGEKVVQARSDHVDALKESAQVNEDYNTAVADRQIREGRKVDELFRNVATRRYDAAFGDGGRDDNDLGDKDREDNRDDRQDERKDRREDRKEDREEQQPQPKSRAA